MKPETESSLMNEHLLPHKIINLPSQPTIVFGANRLIMQMEEEEILITPQLI